MRALSKELDLPIACMLDTKGPEIRLGEFKNGVEKLVTGQKFTLTSRNVEGTNEICSVTYKDLPRDVKAGGRIMLDDGLIELRIDEVGDTDINCTVCNDGTIKTKKGVNVPGVHLTMPYMSQRDTRDILFGIEQGFDLISASFARNAQDIMEIRHILDEHNSKIRIIAKIENQEGIDNIDEILTVADGIMVARGDMGVEIDFAEIPAIQKHLIDRAMSAGKICITATQMLDSMIVNPRPTRAEITDVANAIYDGTTAIMLSGESAAGLYPVEAVKTMARIAERTEQDINYRCRIQKQQLTDDRTLDITTAISYATCTVAMDLNAAAIITVTMSGFTANMIARYKPGCQIIGCTVDKKVCRQLNLLWGVNPVLIKKENTTDSLFEEAVFKSKQAGLVKPGDTVVITAGVPLGIAGKTDMIHVVEVV